jgi:hypothetical protein
MLMLRRHDGQWVEVIHRTGDRLRIRVCRLLDGNFGECHLGFDDPMRNFLIHRPEWLKEAGRSASNAFRDGSLLFEPRETPDEATPVPSAC